MKELIMCVGLNRILPIGDMREDQLAELCLVA